jgi:mannitol-specific phosphotransferase system IIBC component
MYIVCPGKKSNIGSFITFGFLTANTHHNDELPYKSLANISGLYLYTIPIVYSTSDANLGIALYDSISRNGPKVGVL